ncbi:TPA: DUF3626 domain-containing protein [Serratia marcescens]|nr:DUF3626 domain-containing protein [Serratia marcescens]
MPNYAYLQKSPEASHRRGEEIFNTENPTPAALNFLENVLPKILSKKNNDKEAAQNKVKKTLGVSGQELGEMLELFIEMFKRAPLTINFPLGKLEELSSSSSIVNVWGGGETNKGTDLYLKERTRLEGLVAHINSANAAFRTQFNDPGNHPNSRPLYGALQLTGQKEDMHEGAAPEYGRGAFFLKPRVRGSSTYTVADSMKLSSKKTDAQFINSLAVDENIYPLIASASESQLSDFEENYAGNDPLGIPPGNYFIEAQIHTKVDLNRDIEAFALNGDKYSTDYKKSINDARALLRTHGIIGLDVP